MFVVEGLIKSILEMHRNIVATPGKLIFQPFSVNDNQVTFQESRRTPVGRPPQFIINWKTTQMI
jgi:hypothetical protein